MTLPISWYTNIRIFYHGFGPKALEGCHIRILFSRRVQQVEQELFILWGRTRVHARFFVWFMLLNLLFSAWCFVDHCLGFCSFVFWSSFSDFLILTTCIQCIYPTISDQKNNAKFQNLNFPISPKFLLKFFTALFKPSSLAKSYDPLLFSPQEERIVTLG